MTHKAIWRQLFDWIYNFEKVRWKYKTKIVHIMGSTGLIKTMHMFYNNISASYSTVHGFNWTDKNMHMFYNNIWASYSTVHGFNWTYNSFNTYTKELIIIVNSFYISLQPETEFELGRWTSYTADSNFNPWFIVEDSWRLELVIQGVNRRNKQTSCLTI